MSYPHLAAAARYAARNPKDMMISTYRHKEPTYVEVMSHNGYDVITFRSYMYNEVTDTYYCYILNKMYEQGVHLPEQGETVNLKLPADVLKRGVIDSATTQIVVDTIEKGERYRVAKITAKK